MNRLEHSRNKQNPCEAESNNYFKTIEYELDVKIKIVFCLRTESPFVEVYLSISGDCWEQYNEEDNDDRENTSRISFNIDFKRFSNSDLFISLFHFFHGNLTWLGELQSFRKDHLVIFSRAQLRGFYLHQERRFANFFEGSFKLYLSVFKQHNAIRIRNVIKRMSDQKDSFAL